METLDGRVRVKWLLRTLVAAVVLGGVVALVDRFVLGDGLALPVDLGPLLPVGVGLVVLLLGGAHALALYRTWGFALEDDALFLERGVLTRVETAVPYVRVQHVDTQRGPLDRALGLSSVVVYTAGSRGADVTVPGLSPERANDLRADLRELAIESEPEDAV